MTKTRKRSSSPLKRRMALGVVALLVVIVMAWANAPRQEAEMTIPAGAALAEVVVPDLTGASLAGETAFNAHCADCHGANAAGIEGVAPPLIHIIYEPNHHSDAAFRLAAQRGVRAHHWSFGDMPPVEGVSDDEMGRIIAYVRTLQRANGIN